jgi:glycine/serine hydroxymethyltransferase
MKELKKVSKLAHMEQVAHFIDQALQAFNNEAILEKIRGDVNSFMSQFDFYKI